MSGWRVYQKYVVVALVAILLTVGMSYLNQEPAYWNWPQAAVRTVLQPLQRVAQGATDRVAGVWHDLVEMGELREENRRLQQELEEMEMAYNRMREIEEENERLTGLLELEEENPQLDFMAARVLARDPDNWHEGLTIDRGSEDGVEPDLPVMTAGGLVGRVSSVGQRQSEVLLLLDQRSSVGALLQESREPGVVRGHGVGDEPLRMLYISQDAEVEIGERVVTSGLGTLFPRGLPLGKVVDVRHDEEGIGKYAVVEPEADLRRIEEVMVVTGAEEGEMGD